MIEKHLETFASPNVGGREGKGLKRVEAGGSKSVIFVAAAHLGGYEWADGVASILIGCVLACVAIFMTSEIRSLIVGEAASRDVQAGLRDIIEAETGRDKAIRKINEIRTMDLGPQDVLVTASVDFEDWVSARTPQKRSNRVSGSAQSFD